MACDVYGSNPPSSATMPKDAPEQGRGLLTRSSAWWQTRGLHGKVGAVAGLHDPAEWEEGRYRLCFSGPLPESLCRGAHIDRTLLI